MAWLEGWEFRKSIYIQTVTEIVDYAMGVVVVHYGSGTDSVSGNGEDQHVYCNNRSQYDFDDIRFTDKEGNVLNYYRSEVVGGNYAKLWFKVSIAESTTKKFYIYYGNPDASYIGDVESTFLYISGESLPVDEAGMWTNTSYYSAIERNQGPSYKSKLVWFKMSSNVEVANCKIFTAEHVSGEQWHIHHKSTAFTLKNENSKKYYSPRIACEADDYLGFYLANTISNFTHALDPSGYYRKAGEFDVCSEETIPFETGGWWVNIVGAFRKYTGSGYEPSFTEDGWGEEEGGSILLRVKEVIVGKDSENYVTLDGARSAKWGDSDPWVILEVPAGETTGLIYQHIKPNKIEGKIVCMNVTSLHTTFYATAINADGDYAVDPNTNKKTKIEYFIIKLLSHLGTTHTYTFTGARVRTIEMLVAEKISGGECPWVISFVANKVVKS